MGISFDRLKRNMARKRVRKLLRWPPVYTLGRLLVQKGVVKFPYRSTALTVDYALDQFRKTYSGRFPSVWTTAFFPTELLHALDISIFSPEVASGVAAGMGFQREFLHEGENRWWGRDNCAFHRCAMGGIHLNFFPRPLAYCASSHLCDGGYLLFANLARKENLPNLLMDVPRHNDKKAREYVVSQLQDMLTSLQEISGQALDPDRLEEAVSNAERARQAMSKVNQLRVDPASPIRSAEAFGFLYLYFTGLGSREMPEIYETLAGELEEKIQTGTITGERPRYRLLWLHLKPFYRNDLLDYLEEKGARIIFEEFNHVYWGAMDEKRPLDSIADRMLSHFIYGDISQRLKVIKALAERYKVDGVIHFSHWGCHQNSGSLRIIRDFLRKEGLPFLSLDGDCIDDRNYAGGQMQTRIDGFLEMLS